jgi:hypothetical protein
MADSPTPDPYARRRATVATFLREQSTMLAELYTHGCELTDSHRPEGWTHMVGHVGRELMNRLADYIAEVPVEDPDAAGGPVRPEAMADALREALGADADTLRRVVEEQIDATERGRRRAEEQAALLVAQAEEGEVDEGAVEDWVRIWRPLQRRFASWAHLRRPSAPPIREADVEQGWRELTDLLAFRIAREPYFESLDELLEIAHRPDPDTDLARRALARLRPGTRRRFFLELRHDAWVGPLTEAAAFARPPEPIREGDTVRFPEWPEGLALLAFAASSPDEVARAAQTVPTSDNARVAQLLAAVAAELPGDLAAQSGLAARVARDLRGTARLLDVADPAGRLMAKLASAGRINKALDILAQLLHVEVRSIPSRSEILPDWKRGSFRHDEYLVDRSAREALPELVDHGGIRTVRALARALASLQDRMAYGDSTRWRDDIGDTRSPFGDDPRHLLLELLRDACARLASAGAAARAEVFAELERGRSRLFRRLELWLLADAPELHEQRREAVLNADLMFSREHLGEVYRLLPVAFAEMDEADRERLLELVAAGPAPERIGLPAQDLVGQDELIAQFQDEWRQRLLSALEGELDESWQRLLDELRASRGQIDRPGFGGVITHSFVGPTSPHSHDQLASMEPDELVAALRNFEPPREFAAPSPEGLGRELARAVEVDPDRFAWAPTRIAELPPTYARSLLAGLDTAVRSDKPLPVPRATLDAIAWVLQQSADPDQPPSFDADTDYYGAQRAAADLLVDALSHNALPLELRENVWALVERLSTDNDPTPARETSRESEPMAQALVSLRSRGALAAVRYLQWLDARLPAGDGPGRLGFTAAPEAQPVLERLLDNDPSLAVCAVLAAELPVLVAVDGEWMSHRRTIAHPDGDERARAGWSAYLRYSAIYGTVVEPIADAYRSAVRALGSSESVEADRHQLVDHVAVIWRDLPSAAPDLLEALLEHGRPEDVARLIATLGRALHPELIGDYEPTTDDLNRHRELWDARLRAGEAGTPEWREFGWWWTSGRLTTPDDVRRLNTTLRLGRGRVGDVRDALVLLDRTTSDDSTLVEPAVETLEVLADARTAQAQYIDPDVLANLLRRALSAPGLTERATALVHTFGEQGYVALRGLLAG